MINDSFRLRYKNIPAAVSVQNDFYQTPLHNHREIEILIIDKGASTVRIGDEHISCCAGELVFVSPMEIHSVRVDEKSEYCHRCVCFDTSLIFDEKIADGIKSGHLHLPRHLNKTDYPEPFGLCEKIFEKVEDENIASRVEVPAYIGIVIGYFIRNGLLEKCDNDIRDTVCESILDYVHKHFAENITSKTAAEAFSFNQSYFCRKFSKNFGMSFSAYLNMYRVSVSRKMLEDGKSVSDTAFECGFSDPMCFRRYFKKYVGILPSEYQKSQYSM